MPNNNINKVFCSLSLIATLTGCGEVIMPDFAECPATQGGNPAYHIPGASAGDLLWPSWGGDLSNTHHAANETTLSTANVNQLQVKWIFDTAGSVSVTPTITDEHIYITDWGNTTAITSYASGGMVHAINRNTGTAEWSQWMRKYNNDSLNNMSRSSPAIFEDLIIIGDVQNPGPITFIPKLIERATRYMFGFNDPCGAYVYGINRHNGGLAWSTRIGTQLFDQISQSPVVYNDTIFVGISSHESTYTRSADVPCCTFRGSFVALDAHTGAIKWRRYMIDGVETYDPETLTDSDQYAGAAIWGGAPTIDPDRNSVYLPTGNNYWIPSSIQNCLYFANGNPALETNCLNGQPDNFFDSIVSLDIDTGNIKWVMKSRTYDAWTTGCAFSILFPLLASSSSTENCPSPIGPDADFAQPPMLVRNVDLGGGIFSDVLYAGTKAGEFFAINPDNGNVIWKKQIGPGGLIGGMQFGAATDGARIYVQNTNFDHTPYFLEQGSDAGKLIQSGFWAALDPATGDILWQTQVPGGDKPLSGNISHVVWGNKLGAGFFAWPMGGLTVANGVVFAGVANLEGTMVAMDASTGQILWQKNTGQSIASSPAIVDGKIYWGTGYKTGAPGSRLYSLGLPE